MLDRAKLFKALEQVENELFFDTSHEILKARAVWQEIIKDPLFQPKVRKSGSPLYPPSWFEDLGTVYPVQPTIEHYAALSVDGSQVYPDRHQGTSCFLINIGTVAIVYGKESTIALSSLPLVFTGQQNEDMPDLSRDTVNCLRQAHEFTHGKELCAFYKQQHNAIPMLLLFDGSLIFWHLAAKEAEIKEQYAAQHIAVFEDLYKEQTLLTGYISLPRSKELVSLVRLKMANFNAQDALALSDIDHVVDSTLVAGFLQPFERTIVFQSNTPICGVYPEHLRPYFFYMHMGEEIARVEIVAWIAQQKEFVDLVASIIADQARKGRGYPVVIAEAHEQAVVKGADRDYFYQVIEHMGTGRGRHQPGSQKSFKKRIVGF
ncbi:MAG: DNA double-strand break repair nuclease NurA [Candidatus Babeliales bacterium]